MRKLQILLVSLLAVFLVAGTAMALPFNSNRPLTLGTSTELSLQGVFDIVFGDDKLDAYKDQSDVAIWTEAEANVDAYLITMISAKDGKLGIYSYSNPTLTYDFSLEGDDSIGFDIKNNGDLYVGGSLAVSAFGDKFGFYWKTDDTTSYTEDDKNIVGGYGPGENVLALSYLIPDGYEADLTSTSLNTDYDDTVTLLGNNDWILAFEDWIGGDGDFQDAVFLVEDMKSVPEPATMLLLGSGLLGLALIGRMKFIKR